ncbi:DNA repair protein RecO [Candidatus Roizmanbacteria bacterium]|nr:DNA repair protein RecO [Candidatus Roizmanbacteria bacterium]
MKKYTVHGIIVKRREHKETDKIVTLVTQHHGKISVIAKGIRKVTSRRGPGLELFNEVMVTLHRGKFLDMVTEVTVVNAYSKIRNDLQRVSAAYELCEIADILTREHQEQQEVFDLLCAHLHRLNVGDLDCLYEFKRDILITLGFLSDEEALIEFDEYIEQIAERRLYTPKIYE